MAKKKDPTPPAPPADAGPKQTQIPGTESEIPELVEAAEILRDLRDKRMSVQDRENGAAAHLANLCRKYEKEGKLRPVEIESGDGIVDVYYYVIDGQRFAIKHGFEEKVKVNKAKRKASDD